MFLEKKLDSVRKRRKQYRNRRASVPVTCPYSIFGWLHKCWKEYTTSESINRSRLFAEDRLFETLGPATRRVQTFCVYETKTFVATWLPEAGSIYSHEMLVLFGFFQMKNGMVSDVKKLKMEAERKQDVVSVSAMNGYGLQEFCNSGFYGIYKKWDIDKGSRPPSFSKADVCSTIQTIKDNRVDTVNFARKPCWAAALTSSIATPKWKSASPYRCISRNMLDDLDMPVSKNSLRGFEVVDEIKAKLEEACPQTSGGSNWELPLGRRDSKTASLSGSNNNIPAPNSTIQNLVPFFKRQGLYEVDLVALSGGHTIGVARCVTFKHRLYNQNGNNQPDQTLEKNYFLDLKSACPRSGGDDNISPLDLASPAKFDNSCFKLLLWGKGLLTSDEVLYTGKDGKTIQLVKRNAEDGGLFFEHFAKPMVKMGNISPLTGFNGEVRRNCRLVK
ncbi:hypothetical protein POTOM_020025 [Populus tomentosa]|uniref:peroxidase n=1 Tax=Populus tomentosa TaxID=118781 RepID=A0A8X7ZSH7_POPTO|nr:hypothetical protein POTOM_020025 [Populus tomentosa]